MTINALHLITKTDSCPTMGDWAIANKRRFPFNEAKAGDLSLFDFNGNGTSDHIGIIESVNKDGSITTIEGNTSMTSNDNGGCVMRRTRYKGQLTNKMVVRPKYTADITPEMILATARSQIGVKESPAGSNHVKYNRWFYNKDIAAFWCATFVCWYFGNCDGEATPIEKPTGKYTGNLPTTYIKQGSTGSEVKKWQEFLNWYHEEWDLKTDSDFGGYTADATMGFQRTEGLEDDGCVGPLTRAAAKKYLAEKAESDTPRKDALIATIKKLSWAKGTAKATYYSKPKEAFKDALEEAYPDRSKWGSASKAGKSCDVGLGVIMRASGVDPNFPRGHDEQWTYMAKHTELYKQVAINKAEPGCIVTYKRTDGGVHTGMISGQYFAEASHPNDKGEGGFYLARRDVKKARLSTSGKKSIKVYKVIEPTKEVKLDVVDLSEHQGKLSDKAVAEIKTKFDYAILRLGIRLKPNWINTEDSDFEYNYKKLHGNIPLGCYFYTRAITKAEAEAEAAFCIEKLQGKDMELPIYLDVEDTLRQNTLTKAKLTELINIWIAAMKNSGYDAGVYASMNFLNNRIDTSKLPSDCSIWVAQYPKTMTEKSAYTGKHDLWQYTSSGKLTNISGDIDKSYCYKEF